MVTNIVNVHPTVPALAAFLDGTLPAGQARDITEHLLSQCIRCEGLISEITLSLKKPDAGSLLNLIESFEGEAACNVEPEALCDEILGTPAARQALLIANSARFLHESVCYELLDRAWDLRFTDPHAMLSICKLADCLSAALHRQDSSSFRSDLRARTLASVANAHRVIGDHRAAEGLFDRASDLLRSGTGDPVEQAHFLYLLLQLRVGHWGSASGC